MINRKTVSASLLCFHLTLIFLLVGVYCQGATVCSIGSFGPGCSLSCAELCDREVNCNSTTDGGCTVQCQKGWRNFPTCNLECQPNYFYYNCSRQCRCANASEVCDRKNGNCQSGCQPDWAESSCHVRMPVMSTPPWVLEPGCGRFLVAFRAFNSSLDVGVGNIGLYQIESSLHDRDVWTGRANVTGPPYQAWIDVGSDNSTLQYKFRVRILYRSAEFYERFAPAGNASAASSVDCKDATPGTTASTLTTATESTTVSTISTTTSQGSSAATTPTVTDKTSTTSEAPTSPATDADTETSSPAETGTTWPTTASPPTETSVVLIVVLCVLVFLALCAALAVLVYRLRARKANVKKPPPGFAMPPLVSLAEPKSARYWTAIRDLLEPRRPVFFGSLVAADSPAFKTMSVANPDGLPVTFQAEFEALLRGHQPQRSSEVARRLENASKNATPLCLPYDYNRLKFSEDENYYNASVVKGYVRRDAYIVAQSPTDARSAELLWRAVLEQNVAQMVSAGGCQETVAFQYWPDTVGQTLTIGGVSVLCETRQRRHEFTVHRLRVNGMRVTHYQLVCRATNTLGLVAMYTAMRSAALIEDGPMLVHCRTGIGPACVFIGIDWLLQQAARENGGVSVYKCVRDLRRGRPNALPEARQYALLYDAIFEALLRRSFLAVPSVTAIDAFMDVFDRSTPPSTTTPLREQLDLLTRLGPALDEQMPATNRIDSSVLIFDSHREAEVVFCRAPPTSTKLDDSAALSASRNAFWLDVLQRRASVVVILDGSSVATAALFPTEAIFASDNIDQQPALELPDLQITFPAASTNAKSRRIRSGYKHRTLSIRPRREDSRISNASEVATKVELLLLSSWSATVSSDDLDEAQIDGLAKAVVAMTTAISSDVIDQPCLLVDADTRRCGLLAIAQQAWRQLIEDGYADLCAIVRRLQRRCGGEAAIDANGYRLIHRCLQRLAGWRRHRSLPDGRRKRRDGRMRRGKSAGEESNDFDNAESDGLWRSLTSTLESNGEELESSIYDYCQLPVMPRANLASTGVYLNSGAIDSRERSEAESEANV